MNPVDLIMTVLGFLGNVPFVGHYLALVIGYALPISGVITALVAVWHAVVALLGVLASVPGLSVLANVANALKTDTDAVDGFLAQWVTPILNRLSMLPLPAQPAAPAAPTNPPAA